MMIQKLRNLKGLKGIHKHWIWGSEIKFNLSCDYLQKIGCSIEDLNAEIKNLSKPTMKEVIYVIVLVDWIHEAVDAIQKLLNEGLGADFEYQEESSVSQAKQYLRAIRSFVVAHPLNTNRHERYGLDGDFICIDVRHKTSPVMKMGDSRDRWYHLNLNGMQENAIDVPADFVLYCHSEKIDGNQFYKIIGANFADLYYVAKLQIERLYALDFKLSKLTKKKVGIQ